VSKDYKGNLVNVKPEFEDIKKISADLGIPLRMANQIALSEIHTRLGDKSYTHI
jgi:pyridinium-3,5-bisthiocarboxylic acid mononucleotide nickel chelatase